MPTHLFISPHLDDVAFSCAGRVLDARAREVRVVVATLFSEGDAARNEEDRAAWARAGVDARHVGLADAPLRLDRELTFTSLMLGPPPDPVDVRRARAAVAALLEAVSPDEVWFPLGIGGHIDHEVAHACHPEADGQARFYFDRPYSFVRALRDARLGSSAPMGEADVAAQLRDVRLMDRFFLPRERVDAQRAIVDRVRSRARVVEVGAEHVSTYDLLDESAALIDAYRSQVRWIFGDEPVAAAYRRLASDAEGRLVERWIA